LQERLLSLGYPTKGIDGVIGTDTLGAIQLYTEKNAVSEKDVPWVLNELRNSQTTSVLVKK
jgi:lysozyme family protein